MKLRNWPICLTSCQGETLRQNGDLALLKTLFKKQEKLSFKEIIDGEMYKVPKMWSCYGDLVSSRGHSTDDK